MPAPENLTVQTPGEPITQPTTEQQTASSTEATTPEYTAKHNGGGRWRIYSTSQDAVSYTHLTLPTTPYV